jgi:CubicO group peptidase (beta-lactamase class C family)
MKRLPLALLGCLLLLPLANAGATQPIPAAVPPAAPASPEVQVDALFAKWNKAGVPGAAVEVIRDGKLVLRKAYGMADIERGVPMTPDAVLNAGSVTKQFTAFAIHLLEQEGKLAIGDEVHRYLPELPDFGKPITLRHLMQHTSGLRDPINLMILGGWRLDDITTTDDALAIIARQRALNFNPGDEYLYSNAGYDLLAEIVRRVSGKPLAAFIKERIFDPLGMRNSSFRAHYGSLVPGRALSYEATIDGGYRNVPEHRDGAGPGGLLSTVDDLARWERNFVDGRVGGKALIARMHETTTLNNGKPHQYASGLFIEKYRGRRLVEHSGGIAGYRSVLARYPDQGLSVILLANAGDINPVGMGRKLADIYLDGSAAPMPSVARAPAPPEIGVDPKRFDALTGYYALSPHEGIHVSREGDALMGRVSGQEAFRLFPSAEREYFVKVVDASISFDVPGADGVAPGLVLHQHGKDVPAPRSAVPLPPGAADYTGEFYSEELRVLYRVALKDGRLVLSHPRGTAPLDFVGKDIFLSTFPIGQVSYQCAPQGGCTGFKVSNGRVRNLEFAKVAIVGAGARQTAATGVFLAPARETAAAGQPSGGPGLSR